jgi:hypothetical protein
MGIGKACLPTALLAGIIIFSGSCLGQHDESAHAQHMADVNRQGAEAMGFDQHKTEHHFRLSKEGGEVDVSAKDPSDKASIEQIQAHLRTQETEFSNGDFAAPEHTHGRMPPGAQTMKEMRSEISYAYEPTGRGGKLKISSKSSKAVAAIHDFLRFQIQDHETGDSVEVR